MGDNPGTQKLGLITNDEYKPIVAKKDATVKLEYNGAEVERVVKAGQQVPADLHDAYVEQHG